MWISIYLATLLGRHEPWWLGAQLGTALLTAAAMFSCWNLTEQKYLVKQKIFYNYVLVLT